MLSVNNVDFCYNNSRTLSNISLNVQAGEYLAVVGESGSGKSTLLKLIYGEFDVKMAPFRGTQLLFWAQKTNLLLAITL